MSTGFNRSKGMPIGENEIRNQTLWDSWVAEGIVIPKQNAPAPQPEPEKVVAPLPQDTGATLSGKKINEVSFAKDGDPQLQDMSEDEIRQMGKRMKSGAWHLMGIEKLKRRIEEQS